MSWFWRMPSMLARSLMREVAAAVVAAHASMASAASAMRGVPSISCSPRGRTGFTLPVACQRGAEARSLNCKRNWRGGWWARHTSLACGGNTCRPEPGAFYRPLTISAHADGMRVQGPNGTAIVSRRRGPRRRGRRRAALSAWRRPGPRRRRRPRSPCARWAASMRSARHRGSGRTPQPRGQAWPPRARRARRAQAARRHARSGDAAAAEIGLRRSPGWLGRREARRGARRDRPARSGRIGQGRNELKSPASTAA
jgi:hypothetical protein